LSAYGRSKAESERVVVASGLDWTIIRPPAVYGPGDRETLELFRMAKYRVVLLPPGGRMSVIEVSDLARLLIATVNAPATYGQCYEPDDASPGGWSHDDFARALGVAQDRRVLPLAMPRRILEYASKADVKWRGPKAKLSADRVAYYCHPDWVCNPDRQPPATLWTPQVPTPRGLRWTARWYREQGWL
jgi:nucleoside-diphosphate-sugar epimerase